MTYVSGLKTTHMRLPALLVFLFILTHAEVQSFSLNQTDSGKDTIALARDRQRIFTRFWDNPALTGGEGRNNVDVEYNSRLGSKYSYFLAFNHRLGADEKLALGYAFGHVANGGFGRNPFPWAAVLTENTLQITASWKFELGDHIVRPGISVGTIRKKVDWEELTFGDMIDPRYGFVYSTAATPIGNVRSNLDLQLGLEYLFGSFYLEIAMRHVTQPGEGFSTTHDVSFPRELIFHSGYRIYCGEKLVISPYLIYRHTHFYNSFTPGVLGEITEKVLVGFSYKNLNTFTFDSGYLINNKLRVLVSLGIPTDLYPAIISPLGYLRGGLTYFISDHAGG